jgi:hypothetical protein
MRWQDTLSPMELRLGENVTNDEFYERYSASIGGENHSPARSGIQAKHAGTGSSRTGGHSEDDGENSLRAAQL